MSIQPQPIGIIGLGLVGSALADRLIENGFQVVGFDVDQQKRADAVRQGLQVCGDANGVFDICETILLSLPTSQVVKEVIDQVEPALRIGHTIIDMTTGNPDEMVALGKQLQNQNVKYAEAAIAGSSSQLRKGEVVLFVAGIDRKEPGWSLVHSMLQLFGSRIFYLGEIGAASRFKLVHNLMLGLHRAVLAEGLTFGQAMGFDASSTLEVLRQSPAWSGVMETKGKKMVLADYAPQARLSQHLKDVRLIIEIASRSGTSTPLSTLHRELLEKAEKLGFGDADNSAIIEAFRKE